METIDKQLIFLRISRLLTSDVGELALKFLRLVLWRHKKQILIHSPYVGVRDCEARIKKNKVTAHTLKTTGDLLEMFITSLSKYKKG